MRGRARGAGRPVGNAPLSRVPATVAGWPVSGTIWHMATNDPTFRDVAHSVGTLFALRAGRRLPLRVRARLVGSRYVSAEQRAAAALGEVLDHVPGDSPAAQAAIRGLNASGLVTARQR